MCISSVAKKLKLGTHDCEITGVGGDSLFMPAILRPCVLSRRASRATKVRNAAKAFEIEGDLRFQSWFLEGRADPICAAPPLSADDRRKALRRRVLKEP